MGALVNVSLQAIADPVMLAPVAIFFVVFGLAIAVTQRQSPVTARLARHHMGGSSAVPVSPSASASSRRPRPAAPGRLAALVNSEKRTREARTLLNRAGNPMSVEAYARKQRLFTFVLAPLFAVLAIAGLGMAPLGFAAAALALFALPRMPAMSLKQTAKKRAKQMDALLSDVLDLLVVCIEGGQSMAAALMQVSNRMDNVASEEFTRLLADITSGVSRRDAFLALADRCQSESLAIACTTIIQADKVGMSIGGTLRTLSDTMRARRRQAAEAKARQAPIKMMPVLVGFMLPTMLALLIGPVALEAMEAFK